MQVLEGERGGVEGGLGRGSIGERKKVHSRRKNRMGVPITTEKGTRHREKGGKLKQWMEPAFESVTKGQREK